MDMRVPPLKIKIMLESNPLNSRILVRRLAVQARMHPRVNAHVMRTVQHEFIKQATEQMILAAAVQTTSGGAPFHCQMCNSAV